MKKVVNLVKQLTDTIIDDAQRRDEFSTPWSTLSEKEAALTIARENREGYAKGSGLYKLYTKIICKLEAYYGGAE